MTFNSWFLFLVMETALSLSPGPAVFYVVSQGARSFPRTLPATCGILSANAAYFLLSASSVGALVAADAGFFTIVKWLGAAYLIFLGINTLRAAAASHAVGLDAGGPLSGRGGDARREIYLGALTLQLSNPKALLFFLALLPQFIDTRRPLAAQMSLLAATSMLPEFCILLGYGWLAHRAAHVSAKFGVTRGMNRWLAWIEGIGLIGCATLVLNFGRP